MSQHPVTRFPASNEFDIPDLRPELQADVLDLPLLQWGTRCRAARMRGTWGFYVDDYRFERLWKDSTRLIESGCNAIIEPNFTILPHTSRAEALYQIYRKRHLARLWQELISVRVLVDLNVPTLYVRLVE